MTYSPGSVWHCMTLQYRFRPHEGSLYAYFLPLHPRLHAVYFLPEYVSAERAVISTGHPLRATSSISNSNSLGLVQTYSLELTRSSSSASTLQTARMPRDMRGTGRYPPQPRFSPFAFYSAVRCALLLLSGAQGYFPQVCSNSRTLQPISNITCVHTVSRSWWWTPLPHHNRLTPDAEPGVLVEQ